MWLLKSTELCTCPDTANIVLAYKTMKEIKLNKNQWLQNNYENKPLYMSLSSTENLKSNKQIRLLSAVPLVRLIVRYRVLYMTTAIFFSDIVCFNLQSTGHKAWYSAKLSHNCRTSCSVKLKCLHIWHGDFLTC